MNKIRVKNSHSGKGNLHINKDLTIETDDTVQYYREPLRKHTIHSELTGVSLNKVPLIEIVYSYAGATGAVIDMVTQSNNYQGIILAGTGAGRFSNLEEEALSRAIDEGLFIRSEERRVGNEYGCWLCG